MGFITKYLIWLEFAVFVALIAIACYGSWHIAGNYYKMIAENKQIQTDKAVQEQLTANMQLLAENAALRKTAEENRAKNQLVVNSLAAQLVSLRIHIPDSGCAMSKDGITSQNSDGRTRILSARVDEEFAKLQGRAAELVGRCDQLNLDAIQANGSVN